MVAVEDEPAAGNSLLGVHQVAGRQDAEIDLPPDDGTQLRGQVQPLEQREPVWGYREHGDVDVTPRTAHADVQAFALGTGYDGPAPASFDDLFAFDGQDLDNLLYYLGGWSSESCKANGLCNEAQQN